MGEKGKGGLQLRREKGGEQGESLPYLGGEGSLGAAEHCAC